MAAYCYEFFEIVYKFKLFRDEVNAILIKLNNVTRTNRPKGSPLIKIMIRFHGT